VELKPLADHNLVHGVEFVRIPLLHGEMPIAGYRFGNAAYMTDVSAIPESSFALLEGVEVLAISALRHSRIPATPPWSSRSRGRGASAPSKPGSRTSRTTWATKKPIACLPENARLAYDGLSVPVTL
jgi:phosphoribosyl 1,2-cyclic phosphate phosphodiesterase